MKKIFTLMLVSLAVSASAQNLGTRYEFINTVADKIPVKSNTAFYDSSISLDDQYSREQLEANAAYFFSDVFGSDLVKKNGKHSTTAAGTFSYSINNGRKDEDMYIVNYWIDITVKDGRYYVCMHDFTIEHNHYYIDFASKLTAAKNKDGVAKQILAIFHSHNMDVMSQVYKTMARISPENLATAKK